MQTAPLGPLAEIKRLKYKFTANCLQAKELASVESSGLSNPKVGVQCMESRTLTKAKKETCFPLWFEVGHHSLLCSAFPLICDPLVPVVGIGSDD